MTTRIYLVSGPRNISTALMYSFRSRPDTTVYDEPLYGHYLRVSGIDHPGRDETLATEPNNGEEAIRNIILGDYETPVAFFKSMGHHTTGVGLDLSFLDEVTTVFLTREPRAMIASLAKAMPRVTAHMTGLEQQCEVLDLVLSRGGDPIVLESRLVLDDPAGVLEKLCQRVGIPWDPAMLSWEKGPKPEDGTWGKYFYARLWETTGFEPYRPATETLPPDLEEVARECDGWYERLATYAIGRGTPDG